MKTTARFHILRKKVLGKLFTVENLTKIWRSIVRSQLRTMDILDLHDYYDFNFTIESRSKEIRNAILSGQYKSSPPLIYKVEKKYGICRHVMIPSPSDSLVFQTITEYLSKPLKEATPTEQAYYSRDKHHLKLPHEFQTDKEYPWFILWPKFQKEIYQFSSNYDYLVVTDLANFFDNIGIRELRHIVSSRIKVDEVILDLLFNIIEQLSWVPDYLPSTFKGLPTINLEAFRLLPHVMLFEVDEIISKETNQSFVRWVDDINFGINDKDKAFKLLGDINDVLKSRGLALNLSKTTIYTAKQAKEHFMFEENKYLDECSKLDIEDPKFKEKKKQFLKKFRDHKKNTDKKNWDKVTKRYFSVAGKHKIVNLRKDSYSIFIDCPGTRKNIIYYLLSLGYSKHTGNVIIKLIRDTKRYDDITLFMLINLVIRLEVPTTDSGKEFIDEVDKLINDPVTDFDLYCYLWFSAKYKRPHHILNTVYKSKKRWRNQHFLSRQVVSILPRALLFKQDTVVKLLKDVMANGTRDSASAALNIDRIFSGIEKIEQRLYGYLCPPNIQRPYPLAKYLVLLTVLSSVSITDLEKKKVQLKIKEYIKDPWYLYWLEEYELMA